MLIDGCFDVVGLVWIDEMGLVWIDDVVWFDEINLWWIDEVDFVSIGFVCFYLLFYYYPAVSVLFQ